MPLYGKVYILRIAYILLAAGIFSSASSQAQSEDANPSHHGFLLGHNLTATSDILEEKTCSVGTQAVACRLTSRTLIGTSPWMHLGFRMWNVAIRHVVTEDGFGNRWAIQGTYFETFGNSGGDNTSPYDMRALWLQGIRTLIVRPWYRLHLNAAVNYYYNDRRPFSLRRPAVLSNPTQINLSSLHQFGSDGWMVLGELGILDAFRKPLHTHLGLSFGFDGGWYSWHLGLSVSTTLATLLNPSNGVDYQSRIIGRKDASGNYSGDGNGAFIDESMAERDFGFHPEFALQINF